MKHTFILFAVILSINIFATEKWGIYEATFEGPKVENPFTDVELSAEFRYQNQIYYIDGFYDGDQTYKIRFMPDREGKWSYTTISNVSELNNKTGEFICSPPLEGNHGPVYVSNTYHFAYADGTPFYVLGTTAYAWVHQDEELIGQTLETLENNAFNKVRMAVMPKQYGRFIQNEPPYYPFEGSKEEGWNFKRFNVEFFQHFEKQVEALRQLNIEADVILFHPYDWERWGFNLGSIEENILYLRYLVARLAAYSNVWWSMANEYDIMEKSDEEWITYFKTILTKDPYQHLRSIHNGKAWYDHSQPWITHLSVQTPYLEHTQKWRETYNKPVINDEFVYEGNIPHDWGNLTAEETVNRFWTIYCRGGYASHGETYEHPDNILWWSKGGTLYGKSPERLSFLLSIMKQAPEKSLIPFHNTWNKETYLYTEERDYMLFYYGNSQQASALLYLPENKKYRVEVIDAWNMSIEKMQGEFSGKASIPLPQKAYMAVRARQIK